MPHECMNAQPIPMEKPIYTFPSESYKTGPWDLRNLVSITK